ncbi:hypothetical protein [Streptomyces sp. NPDC001770]
MKSPQIYKRCNVYVRSDDGKFIRSILSGIVDFGSEGSDSSTTYLRFPEFELYVAHNDYEGTGGAGFLDWPLVLELENLHASPGRFVRIVQQIIDQLFGHGVETVPDCDFEDEVRMREC